MYDDNAWNDLLYLFNDKALEEAVRMVELIRGQRAPKYRRDGYRDFTRDFGHYNLAAVRKRLRKPTPRPDEQGDALPRLAHPEWQFPALGKLAQALQEIPATTTLVIVYPPVHARYLQTMAATMSECKARSAELVVGREQVVTLDKMLVSALTNTDSNFWDSVHTTSAVARDLEGEIAASILSLRK
jgi:hypothetical protein